MAAALLATAACGSAEKSPASSGSSTSSADKDVLGSPNKVSGTPIKIGFVYDGPGAAGDATDTFRGGKAATLYANDYLGGINGHPIDLVGCDTKNTPSGGTSCAVTLTHDKVAAVGAASSTYDGQVFNGLSGSGIPYFTDLTVTPDILLKPGGFVLNNPLAALAACADLAKSKGMTRSAILTLDVPAASAIGGIAQPLFAKAGVKLDIIKVSSQVADMSPQVQQAIGNGAQQVIFAGTEQFAANGIKALKQAGFKGDMIFPVANPGRELAQTIPGGFEGVTNITTVDTSPSDKDVKLFHAAMDKYAAGAAKNRDAQSGYITVLGLARALTGATQAIDAPSVSAVLSAMPKPVALAMGNGITFQCGAKVATLTPNVCSSEVLQVALDKDGQPAGTFKLVDVSQYLKS
jgi:branched-chain amino acid transport system substrate-binding protein